MTFRLRRSLSLGVAIFVILMIGGVGAIGTYGSIVNALNVARQLQEVRAQAVTQRVVGYFDTLEEQVSVLYEVFATEPGLIADRNASNLLTALVTNLDGVRDITLLRRDESNVMVYWGDEDKIEVEYDGDLDDEDIEFMLEGRPGDGTEGFEDLYMEPYAKRPVISFSLHLGDADGRPIGTVYLDSDVTALSEGIAGPAAGGAGQVFVIDGRGVVMAHVELLGDEVERDDLPRVGELGDPLPAAVFDLIEREAAMPEQLRAGDTTYLLTVARTPVIGDTPWYVVSAVPRDVVLGDAVAMAWIIASIGLATLIAAIGVAIWIGRLITTPVSRLAAAADAIQRFDLSTVAGGGNAFVELAQAERAFAAMLGGLRVFARYVPKKLVQQLINLEAEGAEVVAENRVLTILFSDIAGFTGVAATMRPDDLARTLNEYFTVLAGPVLKSDGTLDKFIGDALMAFWGAPVAQVDHTDRALLAALAMRREVAAFNVARKARGLGPLRTRIGIHTGEVLVGNIGAEERLNYTIVGDAVNAAARLEALGKEVRCYLCISAETRAAAKGDYPWREIGTVLLRGRAEETTVYTIDDDEAAAGREDSGGA
jgi:adenylate cyclase